MTQPSARPEAPELDRTVREALARREPGALETFFDAYFDRVHGYVRRLVREEHTAEDLTQDVFLHVHRALPTYDPSRPLAPWVFTIASNKLRDHWRSRRAQPDVVSVFEADADDDPALVAAGRDADEALQADELAGRVAAAIEALPELLRQTLVLRYHEGLSFEDIGQIVGRNETAVRKRYSRALQELRRALAPPSEPAGPGTPSTGAGGRGSAGPGPKRGGRA